MRLILARHGQTEWNAKRLIQGYADIPLNEAGIEQAHALGLHLVATERCRFPLILASDLLRARQTAEIVRGYFGSPIVLDPRLRETSFGSLEGLNYEQYDARCGAKNLREHPNVLEYDFTPFGGEAATGVLARIRAAIASVSLAAAGESLLIVSHGRAMRTLYYALQGVNRHFDNCAHVEVEMPTP